MTSDVHMSACGNHPALTRQIKLLYLDLAESQPRRATRARGLRQRAEAERAPVMNSRGAVMFVAIFMACLLIGMLWSIMGVGDALIARQLYQESADSAAFSAATIHAKGMNIIAAINLMMMAIVFFYLLLCLAVDVLLTAAAISAATLFGLPLALRLVTAAQQVDSFANGYKSGMKVLLKGLGIAQTATAYLTPWLGAGEGTAVSKNYGYMSVTISPSMVPGPVSKLLASVKLPAGISPAKSDGAEDTVGQKLGLPVTAEKASYLCQVVARKIVSFFFDLIGMIPLIGSFIGTLKGFVSGIVGDAMTSMHCAESGGGSDDDEFARGTTRHPLADDPSYKAAGAAKKAAKKAEFNAVSSALGGIFTVYRSDDLWGDTLAGPKAMYAPAENGTDWNQVYSFSFKPFKDAQKDEVRIGTQARIPGVPPNPPARVYSAQAEFYFDCDQKWTGENCNFDGSDKYDHAIFSMRWRARLVRFRNPAGTPATVLSNFIATGYGPAFSTYVRARVGDAAWFKTFETITATNKIFDKVKSRIGGGSASGRLNWDWVNGKLDSSTGAAGGASNDTFH
jgi:hypothetical protein